MRLSPSHLQTWFSCVSILQVVSLQADASLGVLNIQELLKSEVSQAHPAGNDQPSVKAHGGHRYWTHPPKCARSTSLEPGHSKYCVYSNRSVFLNGISIISTAEFAATAIQHLNEEPLHHFLSDSQIEEWSSATRSWKIVEIPNKGKGVVATHKIRQYEAFMVDQASVIVESEVQKVISREEYRRLLRVAVDRLRHQEWVSGLSGKADGGPGNEEDIVQTNAFGTEMGDDGKEFQSLFPTVSRINHACDPNAFVMFSRSGFTMGIKAYRDIAPGEEITISYLIQGQTHEKRQKALQRWNFTCTCTLCSQPPSTRSISDLRRERIEAINSQLPSLWREGRHQAAIYVGEEILQLMKEEGLTSLLPDVYVALTRLNLAVGEKKTAVGWANEALEILENLGFLGQTGREGDAEGWGLERLLGSWRGL